MRQRDVPRGTCVRHPVRLAPADRRRLPASSEVSFDASLPPEIESRTLGIARPIPPGGKLPRVTAVPLDQPRSASTGVSRAARREG